MIKKIIISLIIIGIGFYGFIYWLNNYTCYTEYRVLTNQYIDNTSYLGGGNCSKGCLFMETIKYEGRDIHSLWFLDNYSKYEKHYLYFANENHIRTDLEEGTEISINWCPTKYGDRIRGIQ